MMLPPVALRHPASQSPVSVGLPVEDRDRKPLHQLLPGTPARQFQKDVCTHQPYKSYATTALQASNHLDAVPGAEPLLDVRDDDLRVAGHRLRRGEAVREARHATGSLERILGRDQPPHAVEPQAPEGLDADRAVPRVRRVEGAAEQPDPRLPLAARLLAWPQRPVDAGDRSPLRHAGRIWPLPRTTYLKLVSCSTPTGPRACRRLVEMPTSAPMPNSPPSANWVEALCMTMALSTAARKR